jgi:hypothetical protein
MSQIGGKGGAKRKTHPLRIEMARKAAAARWLKAKRLSMDNANHEPNEKITENKV